MKSPLRLLPLFAACLLLAHPAGASLIFSTPDETSGTGLGAVNTVLTIQSSPSESGCVGWNGSMTVTGASVCPAGISGGDETAINTTPTLAELGLSSAFNLRLVFNYNESNLDNIVLQNLVLRIYAPDGSVLFDSGPFAPQTFTEPFSGTGKAGFVFRLDAAQALEAQQYFGDPTNRIGLAASATGSDAGSETFFIADASILTDAAADLSIIKTDSPDPVAQGATLTYTLAVTNDGPNTARDVVVVDQLPSSVTFVSATTPGGSCSVSGRIVTCALGTVAVGATENITITVTAPNADRVITNTATVRSELPDPDTSDNSAVENTTVGLGGGNTVDLSLTKTDSPDPVTVGGTLTYQLTVQNAGPGTATGVTLTDSLPANVTFQSATATAGTCNESGGTVTCDLGSLAAMGSVVVTIVVTAPDSAQFLDNTANVSAEETDTAPDDNSASATTEVVEGGGGGGGINADLSIVKNDSTDPAQVGTAFSYNLSVQNLGPDTATGVVVTDTLPVGLVVGTPFTSQGVCTVSSQLVTCDIGTMSPNATVDVTIPVTANAIGVFTDVAAVSGNENDPVPANNSDLEETRVEEGTAGEGPPVPIPTLGETALGLLGLLLAGLGVSRLQTRA